MLPEDVLNGGVMISEAALTREQFMVGKWRE
jgi:hypothetical protein